MSDFPTSLKPVVNEGYGFDAADNISRTSVQGGSPLQVIDYKYGTVRFPVSIVGTRLTDQVFQDFFYGEINAGADKFNMILDSGNGLEVHVVQIVPGSLNNDGTQDPIWVNSFTAEAERTPAQDAPFGGGLGPLYDEYGDGLQYILDALSVLVTEEWPVILA